jgi:Uma2 family endonuclease
MRTVPHEDCQALRLTPEQFAALCAANPSAVLELTAAGQLIERTPTGGESGRRNNRLAFQMERWARTAGDWCVFDSSTGFLLPDGSILSPDASAIRLDRWQSLSPEQRQGVPPLCPDLVVELASASDRLTDLERKMATYQANGAQLGWLLLPASREVEVWRAQEAPVRLQGITTLEGGPLLPELQLDLSELWEI